MARKGGKIVIYESQILRLTLYHQYLIIYLGQRAAEPLDVECTSLASRLVK